MAPAEESLFTNFKPKLACACVSDAAPGVVMLDSLGNIECGLPNFNPDGSVGGLSNCGATSWSCTEDVTMDAGAACVDHCQARYESCVSHTANRWGFGVFAVGAASSNRKANACRENLGACYGTCR